MSCQGFIDQGDGEAHGRGLRRPNAAASTHRGRVASSSHFLDEPTTDFDLPGAGGLLGTSPGSLEILGANDSADQPPSSRKRNFKTDRDISASIHRLLWQAWGAADFERVRREGRRQLSSALTGPSASSTSRRCAPSRSGSVRTIMSGGAQHQLRQSRAKPSPTATFAAGRISFAWRHPADADDARKRSARARTYLSVYR